MVTESKNLKKDRTKVSFWLSNKVLGLVDQVAEDYEMTRSVYLRLVLRETLVVRGLLPREKGILLTKETKQEN